MAECIIPRRGMPVWENRYDENTILLIHNGEIKDFSQNHLTITNNSVTLDSNNKMFGYPSMLFNGSAFLDIPSELFNVASGDLTVDMWIRPTSVSGDVFVFSGNSNGDIF